MKRIIVQVEEDLLGHLDDAADEEGISRAAVVRRAVAIWLAERRRRLELQEIIDSYTARPMEEDLILPKEAIQKAWPE